MQKLTITFEHDEGKETISFERTDYLESDGDFWNWFLNGLSCIGLDFVKKEFEGK